MLIESDKAGSWNWQSSNCSHKPFKYPFNYFCQKQDLILPKCICSVVQSGLPPIHIDSYNATLLFNIAVEISFGHEPTLLLIGWSVAIARSPYGVSLISSSFIKWDLSLNRWRLNKRAKPILTKVLRVFYIRKWSVMKHISTALNLVSWCRTRYSRTNLRFSSESAPIIRERNTLDHAWDIEAFNEIFIRFLLGLPTNQEPLNTLATYRPVTTLTDHQFILLLLKEPIFLYVEWYNNLELVEYIYKPQFSLSTYSI